MNVRTVVLVLGLLTLLSTTSGGYLYYHSVQESALKETEAELVASNEALRDDVVRLISFNQNQVKALAGFDQLQEAVVDHQNRQALLQANRVLDHFAEGFAYDVCFLINSSGKCIGSSNRNHPDSFVGVNYLFRKYFQDAIQGRPSVELALGLVTGIRGIFVSHPVYLSQGAGPIGVVVIKISTRDLDRVFSRVRNMIGLLVNNDGMIFVSSRESWILNLLWNLSPEDLVRIKETKQFGKGPWYWTGLEKKSDNQVIDGSGANYDIREMSLENCPGWRIVSLYNHKTISGKIFDPLVGKSGYIAFILCLMLGGAVIVLYAIAQRDIRGRKESEDALRGSERFLRQSEKIARIGGWKANPFTNSLYWSEGVYDIVEAPKDYQPSLDEGLEFYTLPYRPILKEALAKTIEQGEPFTIEAAVMTTSGKHLWTEVRGLMRATEGEDSEVVGSLQDITERKLAEEALRTNERKYRLLFDIAPIGIILVDKEGKILEVNRAILEILGSPGPEATKAINILIFPPIVEAGISDLFRTCMTDNRPIDTELFYTSKWGKEICLRVIITPKLDEQENVEGCLAVMEDVMPRKLAEKARKESQEKYRLLFENAPVGIVLVDKNGKILEVNEQLVEVMGSPSAEKTKKINVLTFQPMVDAGISKRYQDCITKGEKIDFEVPYTTKWGKKTHLRIVLAPVYSANRKIVGCLAVYEDIMQRKKAEEASKESEEKYRALIETTDTGYLILNSQGKVTDANSEYVRLSGHMTLDEIIDKSVIEWTAEHHKERNTDEVTKCLEQGYVRGLEIDYVDNKGHITSVEINGTVVNIGQSLQIVALCRDITERKGARDQLESRVEERTSKLREANEKLELEIGERERAELELQGSHNRLELALDVASRLRVQAEAASASKTEFLTNMSHELRTPLTSVIGFSDLLADQLFGKLNEKQAGYVKEISAAGRHLLRLINDILDLAKVESGKMDIRISTVDLSELLEHCRIMIRETAIKRGLKVDLKVFEQLHEEKIQADDVRLKQIVMNLLSNAAKFTPSGGTIRMEAERRGEEILVSVSDTGIGLKPEDQERIFQAFEQLDSSFSRREQGTGLGLALVRKLIELHGGRIWVESDGEGMGSTFRFIFPFIQAEKYVGAQKGPEPESFPPLALPDISGEDENRPKVLVVEDNESNMKFITDLLEATGYKALHSFSAEEAIEKAQTEKPALILMDISLPGLDGLEATKILKRNSATSHIPVIALTAHAMKDDEKRVKGAGCDAYVLKPVNNRIFRQTLASIIKSGKQSATS